MKNFELKSQKLDEILGFENLMKLIFRLDLTHKNNCNSLNFEIHGSSFRFSWLVDLSIVLAMALQSMDGGNWW